MKTNKAPEKLYLDTNDCFDDGFLYAFTKKEKEADIEYTRTDAFIENACEFIAENMTRNGYALQTKAKFIKEFRNYMKGG